jgi:hypothetical protein
MSMRDLPRVETPILYKIFHDLPSIPDELIDEYIEDKTSRHHFPQIPVHTGFIGRDDGRTESPNIIAYPAIQKLSDWVTENISHTNRGLIVRTVNVTDDKNFYPPHIDINRKFVMLYNVLDSGGDFIFWQEEGHPLTRSMLERQVRKDYTKLTEICRFKPPVKTWYLINTQVIHSVENLTGKRINLQFNLEPTDKLVLENLY